MVQPKNTDAIVKATHRSWEDWVALFDQAGARQKDHTAIATLARELMPETVAQKEWWAKVPRSPMGNMRDYEYPVRAAPVNSKSQHHGRFLAIRMKPSKPGSKLLTRAMNSGVSRSRVKLLLPTQISGDTGGSSSLMALAARSP